MQVIKEGDLYSAGGPLPLPVLAVCAGGEFRLTNPPPPEDPDERRMLGKLSKAWDYDLKIGAELWSLPGTRLHAALLPFQHWFQTCVQAAVGNLESVVFLQQGMDW